MLHQSNILPNPVAGVWHERSWFFGPAWSLQNYELVLVPLLAVPQITHYVLDGVSWKRKARKGKSKLSC